MDDYGSVVYLDVQKTGSTFVSAFLRAHLDLPLDDLGEYDLRGLAEPLRIFSPSRSGDP